MKIIATMPVRNEDWVLGLSARAALMWCDELVIGLHACTDASEAIAVKVAHESKGRVTLIRYDDPVWHEMAHRQTLLETARQRGATHIAIVDADEVLTSNLLLTIRGHFEATPRHSVLQIPWLALRGSIGQVHTSGPWADGQNVSTGFVDSPQLHWAARNGYDFHHRHPMGRPCVPFLPVSDRNAGLLHLQFVSGRRLRAKQALYKMIEVLRWPDREPVHMVDRRYNLSVYGSMVPSDGWQERQDATLSPAPLNDWWGAYANLLHHFHPHATPWQETEVWRLVEIHGRSRFAGLDLFGVDS